jgi:hypothetical protein
MKSYISKWLGFVVFISAVLVSGGYAQNTKTNPTPSQQVKMIDAFDQKTPKMEYLPYRGETVINQEGYGIYWDKADVQLSRVTLREADKALRIQYDLPPFYPWGNWASIRKEFKSPMDLSDYTGLELDVKVEIPSNAILRITLADVENLKDAGKHGADELWWFDFDPGVLKNATKKWVTIRAPFKDFYLSWGDGTRRNNGQKDLSMIVGYEVNIVSKNSEYPRGSILVNSLRAFKNKK